MPGEWEPARIAQLVAVAGVLVHVCWVRRWNARRTLRAALRVVEADVRADVVEGYVSARSAAYVTLLSRLVRVRERPSRAVHLLSGARAAEGDLARTSFPVGECPPADGPRLSAYAEVLDDAVRDYVSAAHPLAWWQLRSGRPVRRLDLGRTRQPVTPAPVRQLQHAEPLQPGEQAQPGRQAQPGEQAQPVQPPATVPVSVTVVRPGRDGDRPGRTIRLPEVTIQRP
jgi:hypothetical protein